MLCSLLGLLQCEADQSAVSAVNSSLEVGEPLEECRRLVAVTLSQPTRDCCGAEAGSLDCLASVRLAYSSRGTCLLVGWESQGIVRVHSTVSQSQQDMGGT